MDTVTSLSTTTQIGGPRKPDRSSRFLRWLNGGVHWISAFVLFYAFISNGETTRAMVNPDAMKGEVKLGLVVGVIFLFRLIWVRNRRSGGGRWVKASVHLPLSKFRRMTDWGIYIGVAASVVSGLLIAYLRPGAEIVPGRRGFLTNRHSLNAAIHAHVFFTDALEWLCAFHAVYAIWYWLIKRSRWGRIAKGWIGSRLFPTNSSPL
jgi:cytochrome b561